MIGTEVPLVGQTMEEKIPRRQILVINDEPIVAGLLAEMVFSFGYDYVGPALDLRSALIILGDSSRHVDAALIDIALTDEGANQLHHALEDRSIPSAFASEAGRDHLHPPWQKSFYIAKPYSRRDVAVAVLSLLKERNRQIQAGLET